ncbi:MAG: septal ring lytic transglycosylase RlpA family protein [Marinicellaceae bacterium]
MLKYYLTLLLTLLWLTACSNKQKSQKTPITNEGRYAIEQDLAPDSPYFDITTLEEWTIKPEPKSRYGNHSPYVVFGKTYYLSDTQSDFEQTGIASWYGKKFHGHTTSNMEIFDMYKLTAAHRTLPLPSYVEVTNLENDKKIVVRVNDRGPFKSKRIIDLSWAAAKALDYDTKGLAKVHIKLIKAPEQQSKAEQIAHIASKTDGMKFLQVGAFSQHDNAMTIASELSEITLLPVHVSNTLAQNPLYRVRIGPLTEDLNIIDIIEKVHNSGFNQTKMIIE